MSTVIALTTGLISCLLYAWWKVIVNKDELPNAHPIAAFSGLWMLYQRYMQRENKVIYAAHQRHGPVVRLGPKEVSVNTVQNGLQTVYGGNFDKSDFYENFIYFEKANMFSTLDKAPHLARRKILSNVYLKSHIMQSADFRNILEQVVGQTMLSHLNAAAENHEVVDFEAFATSVAMDMISQYVFGLGHGTDFLNDKASSQAWRSVSKETEPYMFWSFYMPTWILDLCERLRIPIMPRSLEKRADNMDDFVRALSDASSEEIRAGQTTGIVHDRLYHELQAAHAGISPDKLDAMVASECMDHLIAGADTTAITLTCILYALSIHPGIQIQLRAQVKSVPKSLTPDYIRELDTIPLLDAIINETLRLYPAVPGCLPRIVPAVGAQLAGRYVKGGTKVSCSAYSLHRNEDVFPNAEEWRPQRWLGAEPKQRTEMDKWLWTWGSGVRMCIGKAFATLEMKVILASIYSRYQVKWLPGPGQTSVDMMDGFAGGPKGVVNFEFMRLDEDDSAR